MEACEFHPEADTALAMNIEGEWELFCYTCNGVQEMEVAEYQRCVQFDPLRHSFKCAK